MNQAMARAHREAYMAAMQGGVAVHATGPERVRNRDSHYRFRPDSDFWYLTGFSEPDAVAVLRPDADTERYVLFVRPRDPEKEVWNGRRAGVDGAREQYGADAAYTIESLDEHLPRLLRGSSKLVYATGNDTDFDRKLLGWLKDMHARTRDGVTLPAELIHPSAILHELRLFKTADELAVLRRCAALTDDAHRAAMARVRQGMGEYEIEALVESTFRSGGGWGPGYLSICAGGANATVLHYNTNNEQVRDGELFLLDAGCELGGYTADVTRTFPVNGRFSAPQREIYDVVLASQVAGCEQVRPGVSFQSVHDVATRKLVEGMLELELLQGSVEENLVSGAFRRFYMHRTSHWLGLDVHDVGAYHVAAPANGRSHAAPAAGAPATSDGTATLQSRPLQPGMVLTVEPGLYVAADDPRAPDRFRGIGVRIEDDLLVTPGGHEILTAAIPKTVAEVEGARR